MTDLITILGPEAAGTTVVADALAKALAADGEVARRHHRLRAGPSPAWSAVVRDEPDAHRRPGLVASVVRVLLLFLDDLVGWRRLTRRLRGTGTVIVESGWWDLVVEPDRFRIRPLPRVVGTLGRHVPTGTTILLVGDAETIHRRRPDQPLEELRRQVDAWRRLQAQLPRAVLIDAGQPLEVVVDEALDAVGAESPQRWRRLGIAGRTLSVPTDSRIASRGAFQLYQPLRPVSRLAWHAGRAASGAGAFRTLPRSTEPRAMEVLRRVIPPGGRAAVLQGNKPGRASAMLFDRSQQPVAVAKVALTEAERHHLRGEVEGARTFGALLEPPLTTPEVIVAADDLAVFSLVPWVPRRRPWELDPAVAFAMGRFHVAGEGGLGHGDFTPWNLLRTVEGWCVLDWERAGHDRPAFDDVLHHLVQSATFLGRPGVTEIVAAVRRTRSQGMVADALAAYAAGAGLPSPDYEDALLAHLDRCQALVAQDLVCSDAELAIRARLRREVAAPARRPAGPTTP